MVKKEENEFWEVGISGKWNEILKKLCKDKRTC